MPLVKIFSHLPVIVDPSHAAGRRDMVQPLSRAAIAAGADGLIIEAHNDPKNALLCDGAQSLDLPQFDAVMQDIRRRAAFEVAGDDAAVKDFVRFGVILNRMASMTGWVLCWRCFPRPAGAVGRRLCTAARLDVFTDHWGARFAARWLLGRSDESEEKCGVRQISCVRIWVSAKPKAYTPRYTLPCWR